MVFFLTLGLACLLTAALTPAAGWVGRRWRLEDRPGGRRKHTGVVPRTGGLAIFGGFFVTVLLVTLLPLLPTASSWFPARNDPNELIRLAALLVGSVYCVAFGLLDDRFNFSSGPQYVIQLGASLIAFAGLIFIKHVNNPLNGGLFFGPDGLPWVLVFALTVFWFMGMMNTINFLDGASGLVAGVTAVLCAVLALHMIFKADPPQLSVALLPLALMGAALGFLPFNFARRIFMGSSGSYFVGFAIAALGIIGGARLATVLMVVGLPALEVGWLMFTRWRHGQSPGQGGRDHLHFRLQDLGVGERTLVIAYWCFCALCGALILLVEGSLIKLAALTVLTILAIGLFLWASRQPVTTE